MRVQSLSSVGIFIIFIMSSYFLNCFEKCFWWMCFVYHLLASFHNNFLDEQKQQKISYWWLAVGIQSTCCDIDYHLDKKSVKRVPKEEWNNGIKKIINSTNGVSFFTYLSRGFTLQFEGSTHCSSAQIHKDYIFPIRFPSWCSF